MQQSKSSAMRSISIILTIVLLVSSVLASTESVSAASKLKVTASSKIIYVGQTAKLKANMNVKWSISNKKIVKLSSVKKKTVTVKGLKAGTVYVKAKAGKKYKKIQITVIKRNTPKKINLMATRDVLGIGEFCTVSVASVSPSNTSRDVNYSSSDQSIATVTSRGFVTAYSPGTVTITASSRKNSKIKGKIDITVVPTRAATLTLNVDLSDGEKPLGGKLAKVWLPVPQNDDYQVISNIKYDVPDSTKEAKLTYDSDGGKQLYIEWDENTAQADRKVSLSYIVYRRAGVRPENIESMVNGEINRDDFKNEFKNLYWRGPLDSGIIKETADQIVLDYKAKTDYEKAYAIYDWMCDNITRYDDGTKPLKSDIVSILGEKRANTCIEVSAVYAALCCAEGIPARSLYGVRFINSNGIPSVNCRAEVYLPGYGWASADPALAIKQSWGHESEYLTPDAPRRADWESIKDNYWINAEENWICLNKGHDVTLNPPQEANTGGEYVEVLNPDNTINFYVLPYVEIDGQYVSVGKYKAGYTYKYEDPLDCACL